MNILIVYAHPNPKSFSYAVLESFTDGLYDGGHSFEIVDLYAINFDPCLTLEDLGQFTGNPVPQEVIEHQEKVAQANALVLICPVLGWFIPAILEGWLQRIFSFGFAWKTSKNRIEGLQTHKKALFITTTGNSEEFYQTTGLGDAINKIIETSLNVSGIENSEIFFLYGVSAVDEETRNTYLKSVYKLGKEFW